MSTPDGEPQPDDIALEQALPDQVQQLEEESRPADETQGLDGNTAG